MPEPDAVVEIGCNQTSFSPLREEIETASDLELDSVDLASKLTSKRFLMLAVILLAFAAFANSISGEFVHDDLQQIGVNPLLGHWDGSTIKRLFTQDLWAAIRVGQAEGQVDSLYYRPLFGLFFMTGHVVAGRNPALWHMLAVLLHAFAAALVFIVLEKSLAMTSSFEIGARRLLAAFAAAVFAVHPAQSESVAWISGAVNPLSAIFTLSAFYCYLLSREPGAESRRQFAAFAAAILLFAMAVLTKESSLALLPIIISYELFILNRELEFSGRIRLAILKAYPYAIIAGGYVALRHSILKLLVGRYRNANFPDDALITPLDNLRTLPALLLGYLKLALIPFDLSLIYDLQYVRSFAAITFWAPLCLLIVIGGVLLLLARRMPELRIALVWMLIPLAPHLNTLVFASEEIIHDRYLYLSLLGVALFLAVLIIRLMQSRMPHPSARGLAVASAAILVLLSVLTIAQNRHWKSGEALWANAAEHAPNSRLAHMALGWVAESKQDPAGALREYEAALRINPDIVDALNNAAFVYARSGHWPEATRKFERIVSLTPNKAIAHFNLSFAYAVQRRYAEAVAEQRMAIELDPNGQRLDEWRARLTQLEKAFADSLSAPSKNS
jgi:protein O-mannosyl-transferase